MLKYVFNFLIFPGFLFTAILGLLASWVDRKLTALIQWRVGPPWYQPFIDILKLSLKEIILPNPSSKIIFFLAPFVGLSAVMLVSTFIWGANINPYQTGFVGDLIVAMYLLTLPSLAIILGASASGNPLASLGLSREIKLLLSYELPFIMALSVSIIKSGGLLKLSEIVLYQKTNGPFLFSPSGIIAMLISVFCMQAKLGLVPFDMGEAETEIMGGIYIEYSGMLLGIFKLTKAMMMVIVPLFLITVLWGGFNIWKYIVLLILMILIKNTNPRVRIDQAMRFFWRKMGLLGLAAILLAIMKY